MPDLPRYYSKGRITEQQTSFLAPEDNSGSQVAEAGQVIGKQVQDVALKWSAAVDNIQKTTALANYKTGEAEILGRAEQDPDYNNSGTYLQELNELKSKSLEGFTNPSAQAEMAADFGYRTTVAGIQVQNLYRKKMVVAGQAATYQLLDMEIENPGPDLDARIKEILAPQVAAGVFDQKEAYKLQKDYGKKGKFNAFLSDVQSSPAVAEANLSNNHYDFNVTELKDAKAIYNAELAKMQAVNEVGLIDQHLTSGDVDVDMVKQMMKNKQIDAKFADSMIQKLQNPKPDRPSQDLTYIEYQNRIAGIQEKGDKAELGELTQFMSDAMKAHADGLLDKDDFQRIVKGKSGETGINDMIQEKLEKKAEQILSKINPKTFLQKLTFWSDEYADEKPEIKARMYRKLLDGMAAGDDPGLLLAKVIDDEIEMKMRENLENPRREYATHPETKQRIYSDDGGVTFYDAKTNKKVE